MSSRHKSLIELYRSYAIIIPWPSSDGLGVQKQAIIAAHAVEKTWFPSWQPPEEANQMAKDW